MGDWLKRHKIHVIGSVAALIALPVIRGGRGDLVPILLMFAALGAIVYFQSDRRLLRSVKKSHPDFSPTKSIHGVGKDSGLLLDEKKRSVVLYGSEGSGIFGYQKMIRSEIVEDQ